MGTGSRYGRKIRNETQRLSTQYKNFHKCPYCNAVGMKRVFQGVWRCKYCGVETSGASYAPPTIRRLRKLQQQAGDTHD